MGKTVIIIAIAISFVAILVAIFLTPIDDITSQNTEQDEMRTIPHSNFAIVGDVGVTKNSLDTVRNLANYDPEVVLLAGDLSYSFPQEWFYYTDFFLDGKIVLLAIGNHEVIEYTAQDWLSYYGLPNEFYSTNYENVHFIALSTETSYHVESEQIKFLETDLKLASINPDIDWIIVFFHKPMYTDTKLTLIDFRNAVQPILDKYEVDLVLQGHSHVYERTMPLKFNNTINDDGQIFVTVGMGGYSHHSFYKKSEWSIIQNDEDFGFLNLNLVLNGKKIRGEFITNDGRILDMFELCSFTCPDLSGEDLTELDLSGEDFSWMNLSGADLSGQDLSNTILVGANLANADLTGVDLAGLDLSLVNLSGVDLSGKDLSNTILVGANLANADLTGVNLSGKDLSFVNLSGVDLSGKDLTGTNLMGANLANADLSGVDLAGLDLSLVNLSGVDLSGKDLSNTILVGANLANADLTGVDLAGLDLRRVNLSEVDLSGKDLSGTNLEGAFLIDSNLSGVDFTGRDFTRTKFVGANLANANLSGVDFSMLDLRRINFSGLDLSGKNFTGSILYAVNFTGANMEGAILHYADLNKADLKNANLSNAQLKETKLDCFNHPICN